MTPAYDIDIMEVPSEDVRQETLTHVGTVDISNTFVRIVYYTDMENGMLVMHHVSDNRWFIAPLLWALMGVQDYLLKRIDVVTHGKVNTPSRLN